MCYIGLIKTIVKLRKNKMYSGKMHFIFEDIRDFIISDLYRKGYILRYPVSDSSGSGKGHSLFS